MPESLAGATKPPRCESFVATVRDRRVFSLARPQWEAFRAHEGQLVEMAFEQMPTGSLAEASAVIAALAAECPVHVDRIEVWPYRVGEVPRPTNVQDYVVLDGFARQLNLPMFAERASTEDTPKLRKHLRDHVFLVEQYPDESRWQPTGRRPWGQAAGADARR